MQHKLGLYLRVSTEEQALRNEGSMESQKHRLASFIDLKNIQTPGWGVVVDSYIDEGLSAKDTRRPAFQRLMTDVRRGRINLILVTDLSRLSRSIRDFCGILEDLNRAKAKFLSLKEQFDTSTPAGEMMLFNMINLAQFERRQISERVALNFHSRALRGLRNGGPAILGYGVDPTNKSRLVVNEKEAAEVRLIFNMFIEEGSTYRAAAKLRELGIRPKAPSKKPTDQDASQWNTQLVQSMLRNQSYIGQREVNKANKSENQEELKAHERHQLVKASWPAIIDMGTFSTVQRMLDANQALERSRLAGGERRVFLLSGLSVCVECGRPLVGSTGHGRVSSTRYYIHRPIEGKSVTCGVKCFRADDFEEAVINHLQTVVEKAGYFDEIESALAGDSGNTVNFLEIKKRKLEQKITKVEKTMSGLIRVQLESDGDPALREVYGNELKSLKTEKDQDVRLLSQIGSQLLDAPDAKAQRETIHKNLNQIRAAWNKAAAPLKKRLLRAALQRLVFHHDSIDVFYRTDEAENFEATVIEGQNQEDSGLSPVAAEILEKQTPLERLSHKGKVQGGYIACSGSGGWI